MKKIYFKLLCISVSTVISAMVAELSLSLTFPQRTWDRVRRNEPAMWIDDSIMPQALKPDYRGRFVREEFDITININQHGFRGKELNQNKREVLTIIAVGDSFTFGWGVEDDETWVYVMEQILAKKITSGVHAINTGFSSGYSPDTYFLFLKNKIDEISPNLVFIGFFIGNDIDGWRQNEWVRVDQFGLPLEIRSSQFKTDAEGYNVPVPLPLAYRIPIWRNSHLMHLLGRGFREVQSRLFPVGAKESIYDIKYRNQMLGDIEKTKTMFTAIAMLMGEKRIPFLVVMIPAVQQFGIRSDDLDYKKPNRIFSRFFKKKKVDYVDLLEELQKRGMGQDLYFPMDEHWNASGHAVAGAIIAEAVMEQLSQISGKVNSSE